MRSFFQWLGRWHPGKRLQAGEIPLTGAQKKMLALYQKLPWVDTSLKVLATLAVVAHLVLSLLWLWGNAFREPLPLLPSNSTTSSDMWTNTTALSGAAPSELPHYLGLFELTQPYGFPPLTRMDTWLAFRVFPQEGEPWEGVYPVPPAHPTHRHLRWQQVGDFLAELPANQQEPFIHRLLAQLEEQPFRLELFRMRWERPASGASGSSLLNDATLGEAELWRKHQIAQTLLGVYEGVMQTWTPKGGN